MGSTNQIETDVLQGEVGSLSVEHANDSAALSGSGNWTLSTISTLDAQLREFEDGLAEGKTVRNLSLDTSEVTDFDTAGAWLVARLGERAKDLGLPFKHMDSDSLRLQLVDVVHREAVTPTKQASLSGSFLYRSIERVGQFTTALGHDFVLIANVIGAAIRGPQMKAVKGQGIRYMSIVHHLDNMALKAVPVIAVMSFLIGAIIAQQGAFQLKFFGEELLTVNLVGILLLREIGVLLTAVMMAGRTGSAITAEIGTMKMREEVDALRVMGLNPIGVLIVPRLIALIIAMPILALLADVAGIAGAIIISWLYVGITPEQFIAALRTAIDMSTLMAGLIKAPFMAIAIALIAAVEGLKVSGSAESLGRHTTNAVVRSIFVVIVLDGIFAIFYAAIGY